MTINQRVRNWLVKEDLRPVLLGENGFFIRDPTFRETHDVLLVLNQALIMINDSILDSAQFRERMATALDRIGDNEKLADITRCLVLAEGESNKGQLVDRKGLGDLLENRFLETNDSELTEVRALLKGNQ